METLYFKTTENCNAEKIYQGKLKAVLEQLHDRVEKTDDQA